MRKHKYKRGRRRKKRILRNGLYRSRNGMLLGVCKGIAEHYDLDVFWLRVAMLLILFLSGLWPVLGIYLVVGLLLRPQPVKPIDNEDEREFYHSYVHSPQSAAQRLKKKFNDLDRRIRRMEDTVTGREYEWERKFNS